MSRILVDIQGVHKSFKDQHGQLLEVLKGINLPVRCGEFLSILGPSGSGKSTLIDIIAQQKSFDSGGIHFQNDIKGTLRMAVVWQEDSLLPWKTAIENVKYSMAAARRNELNQKEFAKNWLAAVGLKGFDDYYPSQLSQGMRKRVALAAALATKPELLLLDEPFGALDVYSKLQVEKEVVRLWEEIDTTVVMVTHDVQEAVALSDRVVVFSKRPAQIALEKDIDLPRPRDLDDLYGNTEFHDFVRELWSELLRQE
ncbi:MAG: ABC transporter ATP-binding protein [Candidatus Thiodiazotropha endolucinida]|nr:ABC transporter ATP-binding protein [Candidatus Thiodiazotropha endolucinida]MCG8094263.1 ABC transporter ATP-binding protein [Candidatus Thiodiazotropha endolucinida]MCW4228156.1 ABC transporter ATP-binding protein [Candidatus Thiodiazotropha taylori]